jgi:A/G-specific adenine glycosylase
MVTTCRWHTSGHGGEDPAPPGSRQSTFDGSDRQGRGRLIDALRKGAVTDDELASVMGWPDDAARATRVVATLIADGLVVADGGAYRLP